MTAGERLAFLSGLSGVSAVQMLMAIGSGATVGQILVDYSGVGAGTAFDHLLVDHDVVAAAPIYRGGEGEQEHAQLVRDHWEYMDDLRLAKTVSIQVADDVRGARTINLPVDMPIPAEMLPVGSAPKRVCDVMGDPLLLAALVIALDEVD